MDLNERYQNAVIVWLTHSYVIAMQRITACGPDYLRTNFALVKGFAAEPIDISYVGAALRQTFDPPLMRLGMFQIEHLTVKENHKLTAADIPTMAELQDIIAASRNP
jgi:hypothetical protein